MYRLVVSRGLVAVAVAVALAAVLVGCEREPAEPPPPAATAPSAAEPASQAAAEPSPNPNLEPLPVEELEVIELRGWPDPHWVFVHDVNFDSMIDGRSYLVDADAGQMLGIISTGFGGAGLVIAPDQREVYSIETYYSRGSRGERTDVVTIYDPPTLSPIAEIVIPAKRSITMPFQATNRVTADGRFLLAFNMTPAQSVSVVDLKSRKFAGEIETSGCALIFPAPDLRFVMLCGDGSLLEIELDATGKAVRKDRTKKFFDPATDPVTEKAVRHGNTWYFISFAGMVHPVGLDGAPAFAEPWSLLDAQTEADSWRPGGLQLAAVHEARGHLYVLMHQGGPGSHKDPGNHIWVYDLAERRRIAQIETRDIVTSIQVSQDEEPLLYTVFIAVRGLDVYDATSGEHLRTIPEMGLTPTMLVHP